MSGLGGCCAGCSGKRSGTAAWVDVFRGPQTTDKDVKRTQLMMYDPMTRRDAPKIEGRHR